MQCGFAAAFSSVPMLVGLFLLMKRGWQRLVSLLQDAASSQLVTPHARTLTYPRAYGGTQSQGASWRCTSGLSPRVRGNQSKLSGQSVWLGTIPARTGEPHVPRIAHDQSRNYPRAYGGTAETSSVSKRGLGLSPRVRGNLSHLIGPAIAVGTIPARTGEPRCSTRSHLRAEDYPRAYGGTKAGNGFTPACKGLSPRVRGNLERDDMITADLGTIPARTGEPAMPRCSSHPQEGLSPRVRGNLLDMSFPLLQDGTIPARTGEPDHLEVSRLHRRDYPRAYGGTELVGVKVVECVGLSPRVRGNPQQAPLPLPLGGTIPARTGEPLAPACF